MSTKRQVYKYQLILLKQQLSELKIDERGDVFAHELDYKLHDDDKNQRFDKPI